MMKKQKKSVKNQRSNNKTAAAGKSKAGNNPVNKEKNVKNKQAGAKASPAPAEKPDKEVQQPLAEAAAEAEETEAAEAEESGSATITLSSVKALFTRLCDLYGFPDMILSRFLGIYLIVSGIFVIIKRKKELSAVNQWREFVADISFTGNILWIFTGFVILTCIYIITKKRSRALDLFSVLAGIIVFSCAVLWNFNNYYLSIGISFLAIVLIVYIVGKTTVKGFGKLPRFTPEIIIFTSAAAVAAFVAVTSVSHNNIYGTSTHDMGLFVQMFHSMSTNGSAVTTCERDTFLSHFYVHASFIYYLLVPIYKIFPNANTLIIAQAILTMGGIIPLYLIAKNHGYKGNSLIAVCMIYIFFGGILAPCYYDFHENAFLPTLLMWTIYAIDKKNFILFYIMTALVCIVKEDAPLYIICISAYFLFTEKSRKRLHGVVAALASGIYFSIINSWLTKNGDGSMMAASRFSNLTTDPEKGFPGIVLNVLSDPAYFFSLLIREESLLFFIQVMFPLLFLPFMTKKIHRFLLMMPFIIMNLVVGSCYGYASNIGYHYIFGPSCLLIYMLIINCDDASPRKRNMLVSAAAVTAFITSLALISPKFEYYKRYSQYKDSYKEMEECLQSVPQDASVLCNTWWVPHIANRDEIYLFDGGDFERDPDDQSIILSFKDLDRYDFVVMSAKDDFSERAQELLAEANYTVCASHNDLILIYVSPDYVSSET